jgi:tRNA threonylcarbamoyladenosine biosynthesis protein TsaE
MPKISKSLEDTKKFAAEFVAGLGKSESGRATVVGLFGNLGSGKTTFVQCVTEIFGVEESVTSPTFVILKSYKLQTKNYKLLVHIDAYRLESGNELRKLGFEEILSDSENLVLVEWPERVADILPKDTRTIKFEFIDDTTRGINFN